MAAMRISVVIPTLNEAGCVGDLIRRTRTLGECEIVVADGGSTDGTPEQAAEADVVLAAPKGRAAQQNAAARVSRGDVLLFLHADCWLEPGAFDAIRSALARPECVGGCFRQAIESRGIAYRLLECGNAWRVRTLKWAYGDQGIFVRGDVFERLGGFPQVKLMEDLLLMKRLRREGRFVLLDARIHVSARRWERAGVVRQTLHNWMLTILAQCGVPPDRLARFYPHVR